MIGITRLGACSRFCSICIPDLIASHMSDSPLTSIWFKPRHTIREILADDPNLYVLPIICFSGIASSLNRASVQNLGDQFSFSTILLACALVGPLGGLFSMWMWSHLVHWTGKWMGGQADRLTLRTAMAWALVPLATSLVIWMIQVATFQEEMFMKETPIIDSDPMRLNLLFASELAKALMALWSFILTYKVIAEVQGYTSGWGGLGNLLMATLTLALPLFLIGMTIALIMAAGQGG